MSLLRAAQARLGYITTRRLDHGERSLVAGADNGNWISWDFSDVRDAL